MLGRKLIDAREELGLSRAQLAVVLGVSPVTVYRWEETPGKVDPLQSRLLSLVVQLSEHEESARYGRALRRSVKEDLPIASLYLLLRLAFGDWSPRSKKGTK